MKAILFDKDGTLLNYEKVWTPFAIKSVEAFTEHFGLHPQKEDVARALGLENNKMLSDSVAASGTGADIHAVYEGFAAGGGKWAQEFYEENLDFIAGHMELIDGSREVLTTLKSLDYKNVIVTSDSRKGAELFVSQLGLTELIDDIVAGDDTDYKKPDFRVVRPFLERHEYDVDDVVMIGDNNADTLLGEEEGLYTIGVLSGTSRREQLKGADLIVDSVTDLIRDGEFIVNAKTKRP
ncbi:HAD family hydrolase [Lacicoccus alkaliphilus]|uniref:Phosphoglycolate phosphatase n=1 Tax=Lacicoccus alkaliphilus DSM 16010 TaxID=1123231 RepID=A0A1M7I0J1_9BACL|nr:HAD family hydrolase [Salinicoccus alkaliphilus]SHM34235.1 phosphoglycolate phosphatase [Salinicoccus alkaliphilus DSM 16010]